MTIMKLQATALQQAIGVLQAGALAIALLMPAAVWAQEVVPGQAVTTVQPASTIAQAMKQLKKTMFAAANSDTVADMSAQVQLLLQQAQQAQTFVYRGNPAERETYVEGIEKLAAALEDVSKLLATGDMAAAKQALADIHKIKLQYHRKLEV